MEEKILFQVKTDGIGTSIGCFADGMEENFKVAIAVHALLTKSPSVALFLMAIHENPELLKQIDKDAVDMPDFDKILKEIK